LGLFYDIGLSSSSVLCRAPSCSCSVPHPRSVLTKYPGTGWCFSRRVRTISMLFQDSSASYRLRSQRPCVLSAAKDLNPDPSLPSPLQLLTANRAAHLHRTAFVAVQVSSRSTPFRGGVLPGLPTAPANYAGVSTPMRSSASYQTYPIHINCEQ
jgi:hypothetical protein